MTKRDASTKSKNNKTRPAFLIKRISEGSFILLLTGVLFVILSLCTYHVSDPSWIGKKQSQVEIANAGGHVGAYIANALYFAFGYCCFFLPIGIIFIAWLALKEYRTSQHINKLVLSLRISGFLLTIIGSCGLLSLESVIANLNNIHSAGGVLGYWIAKGFYYALNLQGASLLLLAFLLVGVTWLTGFSWLKLSELIGFYTMLACRWTVNNLKAAGLFIKTQARQLTTRNKPTLQPTRQDRRPNLALRREPEKKEKIDNKPIPILMPAEPVVINTAFNTMVEAAPSKPVAKEKKAKPPVAGGLPSLSLLDKGQAGRPLGGYTHQELETLSREVEQHLLDFGIQADVVAVHPGPVITRFELQLAAGIKVSKLTALAKDLARSLSVISVRVVEVIPGKTVVGLELPNQQREIVRLSSVFSADVYQHAMSPLTLALGVDIAGHPMVVDLAKMPHLLVAGTTGSGKSVGINAMILSLLFKAGPDQVRLIMIDPKMLELSVYDGIPHLLTPVVTDMKEAASALRWCVAEMERRYRLMAALGVRNLTGFNIKVNEAAEKGEPLTDPLWKASDGVDSNPPLLQQLPYIVVIVDELADMMMVVGKKVEQLIARIAQKARAAGIHLILATQRPSVDVLTGLIKSNIPTRMSFQVSSKIDSRTILDQQGAEQLLGHGDMLYLAPGTGAPLRVHGAFVDDKEVHRIADDWRGRGEPDYIEEITQTLDSSEGGMSEDGQDTEDADPLYDQAVEFIIQTRKASISSVQRRFKIGYNRAARLVEEMERTGIVGPLDGGYRDVLVSAVPEE
ncbi:cell division protein FtsK [Legionella beliardensis]|uniref:DNA translocase FtsK n=1 Tax=Legionella beliardensis TaxID=91822 RepID=A0A378I2J8_9GAMM|nr:DNA translocase FtsK [Legionella beliardensis]STX29388.1 cell division protein FtsK [Legionella beliardensis]